MAVPMLSIGWLPAIAAAISTTADIIPLDGRWSLRNESMASPVWATVPGQVGDDHAYTCIDGRINEEYICIYGSLTLHAILLQVHTDLLAAGLIGEPFNGTNPDDLHWVALSNWTYARSFEVPAYLLERATVQLVSLGVDTVADITINVRNPLLS